MTDLATTAERIIQTRSGGKVERCHAIPHQGSYSNAAHSWGVAMLMHALWPEDFPRLALACLSHDVPESWVGDIPGPTLRHVPGIREQLGELEDGLNRDLGLPAEGDLPPEDHVKLKACDRLELYLWCREQRAMGNQFAEETYIELTRYFQEVGLPSPAQELFELLEQREVLPRQAGVMKSTQE